MNIFVHNLRPRKRNNYSKILEYYVSLQKSAHSIIDAPIVSKFSYGERLPQVNRYLRESKKQCDAAWYEWSLLMAFLEATEPGAVNMLDCFVCDLKPRHLKNEQFFRRLYRLLGLVDTFKRRYNKSRELREV